MSDRNRSSNIDRGVLLLMTLLADLALVSSASAGAGTLTLTQPQAQRLAQAQTQAETPAQMQAQMQAHSQTQPQIQPQTQASVRQPKKDSRSPSAKPAGTPVSYRPSRFGGRAGLYYEAVWGVDSLSVKLAESGEIIRFSWRVLDPDRAATLSNKKLEPSLADPQAGVSLVVPTVENIGMLRQTESPAAGKSYWIAFSNKGLRVKRGDRVDVAIGPFRAEGLGVE